MPRPRAARTDIVGPFEQPTTWRLRARNRHATLSVLIRVRNPAGGGYPATTVSELVLAPNTRLLRPRVRFTLAPGHRLYVTVFPDVRVADARLEPCAGPVPKPSAQPALTRA